MDLPQIHDGFTEISYITSGVRPHAACSLLLLTCQPHPALQQPQKRALCSTRW